VTYVGNTLLQHFAVLESSRPCPWPRGSSRTIWHVLGLEAQVLGLGIGLGDQVLGLGFGLEAQVLGLEAQVLGIGLGDQVLGLGFGLEAQVLGIG